MSLIFISYRQADANAWAIALRDGLAERFGSEQVFLDKDALHAGNWREQLHRALDQCKVVLVVIGRRWLTIADDDNVGRIQRPDDVHHQEIALALGRSHLAVIPVLVDDAAMPRPEQLPEDLRGLCDQQARKLGDTQARRAVDLDVLVADIEALTGIESRIRRVIATPGAPHEPVGYAASARSSFAPVGIAVVLTVCAAILAYLSNMPVGRDELLFLLVMFTALTLGTRWLWHSAVKSRG